jgi:hypothetical protein
VRIALVIGDLENPSGRITLGTRVIIAIFPILYAEMITRVSLDLNRWQHQMVANSARIAASFAAPLSARAAPTEAARGSWGGRTRPATPPRSTARSAGPGARFSVTLKMDPKIAAAIAAIG